MSWASVVGHLQLQFDIAEGEVVCRVANMQVREYVERVLGDSVSLQ
jgi:hypothetical protein